MFNFFKKKKSVMQDLEVKVEEDYNNIDAISNFIYSETGITFHKQVAILKSKVISFCRYRNIESFDRLLREIKQDKELKQEIIDYLTTNETFFYREFKQIQELVQLVKKSNKKVDILCAPCATGEEVYSIAIALMESGVSSSNFKIVGIDINSQAIDKARDAIYGERNIRNLSTEILQKYFQINNEKYILNQSVKSTVSFKILNIFDSTFSNIGRFDFVFCRNMLIYFDKQTKLKAKKILESLRKDDNYEVFFGHADLF